MFYDRLPATLLSIEIASAELQSCFALFKISGEAELVVKLTQTYAKDGQVISTVIIDNNELEPIRYDLQVVLAKFLLHDLQDLEVGEFLELGDANSAKVIVHINTGLIFRQLLILFLVGVFFCDSEGVPSASELDLSLGFHLSLVVHEFTDGDSLLITVFNASICLVFIIHLLVSISVAASAAYCEPKLASFIELRLTSSLVSLALLCLKTGASDEVEGVKLASWLILLYMLRDGTGTGG